MPYHVYPRRDGTAVSRVEYDAKLGIHGRLTAKPSPIGSADSIASAIEIAYAYLGRNPSDAAYIAGDDDLIHDVILNDGYHADQSKNEKLLSLSIFLLIYCFTAFSSSTFFGAVLGSFLSFISVSLIYLAITRTGIQNEVEGGVVCFIILVLLLLLLPALAAAIDAYNRKNSAGNQATRVAGWAFPEIEVSWRQPVILAVRLFGRRLMRRTDICLISLTLAIAVGCNSKPAPDTTVSKDRAAELAQEVREAMTEPSLMQLDQGRTADDGLRGRRQREAAFPFMLKLMQCGKVAEEPLWELINDADENVQRSSVILVGRTRVTRDFKSIAPQTLVELSIPLLERALTSRDSQVRYFACAGLGDFATWSDECLERVKLSLPKLRELRNDGDPEVRNLGWIASNNIAANLSARAKEPEDREMAARELEQLQREKSW